MPHWFCLAFGSGSYLQAPTGEGAYATLLRKPKPFPALPFCVIIIL